MCHVFHEVLRNFQVALLHVQQHEEEQLQPRQLCRLEPPLPATGVFIEIVNLFMSKTLGPLREQFLSDMLPRQQSELQSDCTRYCTLFFAELYEPTQHTRGMLQCSNR